jgi:hypothetical protein
VRRSDVVIWVGILGSSAASLLMVIFILGLGSGRTMLPHPVSVSPSAMS